MTKTHVSLPDAADATKRGFVEEVDDRLGGPEDAADVVADVLVDLNGDRDAYEAWRNGDSVSPAEQARLQNYHPENATLESEYYAEKDDAAFAASKPLQWLWRQFDRTPLADNVDFALAFREMLAGHLFAEAGENLRIFKGVTMTYGHNISIGDNVVVHDHVHLDDRGRLTIGDRVSIADDAKIYSHDHDVVDQTEVSNFHTVVEDDVRFGEGSHVRAGCRIGRNAMVGARAVVQRDVPAHHIAVGLPARSVKIKPGFEGDAVPVDDAETVDDRASRRIAYDLDEDLEQYDEFERDIDALD